MAVVLSVLVHIVCVTSILWLHHRLKRLERSEKHTPQKPKTEYWGSLCKEGRLSDGSDCLICKGLNTSEVVLAVTRFKEQASSTNDEDAPF